MKVTIVTNLKDEKEFIEVPLKIYQNDKNWIRPLDKDIKSVFNLKKNKAFREGEAIRWLITKNNITVGRIAAFYNKKKSTKDKLFVGGCGFFECINDQKVANRLFNTAKKWLREKGCESMDGPINFGERDKWWGCKRDNFRRWKSSNARLRKLS